ncbi:hypothetical protein [Hymenobacter sp. YC55]|uniref:hypothetical protein n=1 Tax=Hymenobacter sp. YC55 TaxID=3034019 RepID=UPI0023F94EA5|nr:hypothetical protein [Hymenobacter sp. YC55]MDF7815420.1 hypothetical protein [Hymenobacter sp. YC55]
MPAVSLECQVTFSATASLCVTLVAFADATPWQYSLPVWLWPKLDAAELAYLVAAEYQRHQALSFWPNATGLVQLVGNALLHAGHRHVIGGIPTVECYS